jgi:hypothetical protein
MALSHGRVKTTPSHSKWFFRFDKCISSREFLSAGLRSSNFFSRAQQALRIEGLLSRRMIAALWVLRSRIAISKTAFLNSQAAKKIA